MKPKISAGTLFKNHWLKVLPDGVQFYESSIGFSARRFRFEQIACVLMSADNELSFQVGNEVFSIPATPLKPAHRVAIDALVAGLQEPPRLRK